VVAPTPAPHARGERPLTAAVEQRRVPAPAGEPAPPDSPTQAELIRQAWSALAVGEADRALSIVRDDAHLHQGGALDEERDAVRIVALARLGHLDEARTAATQFEHAYPSSLHHDLVVRALAGEPEHDR
jgi:hypothetical protein